VDPRQFWELVESSKADADGSFDDHAERLAVRLEKHSVEDIVSFERIFQSQMDRAYSWDLWGAAYVIQGGCSDDGFTDFRYWLISLGRDRFERALADPESLAEIDLAPDAEEGASFEEFGYVASRVYEEKTGENLPLDPQCSHPPEPAGEPWEEDEEALSARYPRLWAKFGAG
jgi:hypothetical protein